MTDKKNSANAMLSEQLAEAIAIIQVLRQQHTAMTERMDTLNQLVMRRVGATSVEDVLASGFETLFTQLEPLRDLTPKRTLLSDVALNRLLHLRKSLDRPDWSDGRAFTDHELGELSLDDLVERRGHAL
jgi:hypothetical protein